MYGMIVRSLLMQMTDENDVHNEAIGIKDKD